MNAPTRAAESTALAHLQPAPALTGRDLILQADNLNAMLTVAKVMAKSRQAVPKHLRENEGACLAVTMQAMRWNMDPFALAVKTYTTDAEGPVAYEGQAIIAALNNSPLLATRLSFKWEGAWERIVGRFKEVESKTKTDAHGKAKKYIVPAWDFNTDEEGLSVTVSAYLVGEAEPRTLTLLMKQARTRNSPLWTEDPKQQLAYLAGRRWGRLHAPDVIMGIYTPDELSEPGERFMGMAEEVGAPPPPPPPPPPAGPAPWPDAALDARKAKVPEWSAAGKTADEVIGFLANKGALSDEQKARVRSWFDKPAAPVQDVSPKVTYAALASRLHGTDDADLAALVLDEARALPQDQQDELAAIYTSKFQPQG